VDTARPMVTGSLRADDMVEAVAFAAERLLLSPDWRSAAYEVLARLGSAAGVSRAYIAENSTDADGHLVSTWVAEWTEPGIVRVMDDPESRSAPWESSGFGRWSELLARGEIVRGAVQRFPRGERYPLERHGVVSLAEHPVFVDDEWWGVIGFDDCERIREWDGEELGALRAASTVLGAAIQRRRHDEQARATESRYQQFVEHIPAVTYLDVEEGDEVRLGFISPQVHDLLGYPAERFIDDPGFWFSIVHPDDHARVDAAADRGAPEPFDLEYRMIAADGRVVWVHDTSNETVGAAPTRTWQGFLIDITARRRTEEQLRDSEERYRALVEHLPAVVYAESIDRSPDRFYLSPQARRIFGYDQEQWKSSPGFWIDRIHPEDRDRVVAVNIATNRTGDPYVAEYRFRIVDGSYRWLHDEAAIVRDPDGHPAYWQGVFIDITPQKEAEERLRGAEERYRALVEHIPAVVYVESLDADPESFYISPQVADVFGYPAETWRLTKDFWIDHVHPDDRPMVESDDERSNVERGAFSLDYRFLAADGSWRWVHDEAVFLHGHDGTAGYWQGFMLDITERKQVEEQLRDAELKFRTIVEQNDAIFYTQEIDPDDPAISYTTYITPGNTDLIGYSIEDIERDPELWRRIIHPEDRERVLVADAASNTGGGDRFSMDYRMIRKDGRGGWVQDQAALVRLPGKPPYWQGFLLDITERKVAEEQIARALDVEREAAKRLRALDEMKNTFLQAVSHDLRTPLAAILGLAITLERGDVELEADDAHDLAGRIAENARKLDRLVTNLLDMDRLARGIVTPKLEPTDMAELVRSVVDQADLIDASRLSLDLQPVVIPLDASKVERIVENLLANTARHTPSNARVWVSVRQEDGGAMLRVEDNGVGVPVEIRESIFEPFQQGPSAPQHSPGVGVGLTLVRRFAELHGGRAWVEDREGGGASFRIFIPITPPTAPPVGATG
jgi:PAS domain S-box-containing protein